MKQTQSALRKLLCFVNTVDILASLKVFGKETSVVLMLVRVVIVDMSDFYSKGHRRQCFLACSSMILKFNETFSLMSEQWG